MRHIDPTASHTCGPVKHPCRDFQKPVRPAAGKIAPKHRIAGLVDRLMDMNKSTKPGMPSIKNLAALSNVGVLTFSCTTQDGRTAHWDIDHRHQKPSCRGTKSSRCTNNQTGAVMCGRLRLRKD
jgi:hypothetical protein